MGASVLSADSALSAAGWAAHDAGEARGGILGWKSRGQPSQISMRRLLKRGRLAARPWHLKSFNKMLNPEPRRVRWPYAWWRALRALQASIGLTNLWPPLPGDPSG